MPLFMFLAVLAQAGGGAIGAQGLPAAEKDRLETLRGKADFLSFGVEPVIIPGEGRWFALESDIESVCEGSLPTLVRIATDFQNTPRVFSRVVSCGILSRQGETILTEQTTGFHILGLPFLTTLRISNRIVIDDPPLRARFDFAVVGGDGSTRKADGYWLLEAVGLPSGPAVHIRYRMSVLVESRYPAQLAIMRAFGKAEFERTLRELQEAVRLAGP